jgi:hypothetical protein
MNCKHHAFAERNRLVRRTVAPLLATLSCGGPAARGNAYPATANAMVDTPRGSMGTSGVSSAGGEAAQADQALPESDPLGLDESPVATAPTVAVSDSEPEPTASRFAPALMRKGSSCWIHDEPKSGTPVVVALYANGAAIYVGTCWAGYFDVRSTAARPFHTQPMTMATTRCVDKKDATGQQARFYAFSELIQRTYDIRVIQDGPTLIGAKGQRLAALRSPSQEEKAKNCPEGFAD